MNDWFCERGDFWGTINQLCLCAKCGKIEMKRNDEPRHFRGIFTPYLHQVCDECFGSLADEESASVGRNPEGENTEECLSAQHEHAVGSEADETPITPPESSQGNPI